MSPRFEVELPETPVGTNEEEGETADPGRRALLPDGFAASYENLPTFITGAPAGGNNPAAQGATGQPGGGLVPVEPRYFQNDEAYLWFGDGRATAPRQMSAETIADYQRRFVAAGLMSEGSYSSGEWDNVSVRANRELLRMANVNGTSATNMLAALQNAGTAARQRLTGSGSGGRVAPTIRLTNTDDLKATFRQVARQTTGGVFVDDSQLDAMVEAYHQKERDYQRSLAGGGGTAEAAPSAGTFAATSLEEMDPGAATGNRFAQMTAVLGSMVS